MGDEIFLRISFGFRNFLDPVYYAHRPAELLPGGTKGGCGGYAANTDLAT